ncbi:hypothetical protein E2542_SST21254 [Spatholobus suberectus]|nr:hypothetical protein E2542_SST21254 [Spatholobus suberectus]
MAFIYFVGGRALRVVAKAKRHQALENTWKAITEGRSMPLSRHVKKCDTWQNRNNCNVAPSENKSEETFNDAVTGRLRKEPSLSQRRVESARGSVYTKVQRRDEVAKTTILRTVHADD